MAIIYKCNMGCLQSRKYCEAIMDDLLLFMPTIRPHMTKLVDILKALHKMVLKYPQRSTSCLKQNYNTWEMLYSQKIEMFVQNL